VAHGTATGALEVWQLTVAALGGQGSGDWEHEEENAKRESSLLSSQRYRQARGRQDHGRSVGNSCHRQPRRPRFEMSGVRWSP
jgi:hypothetical protein